MSKYTYKALNNEGAIITGQLEAGSRKDAGIQLNQKQLLLVELQDQKEQKQSIYEENLKVPQKEIVIFTKQLLALNRAGLPLVDSLNLLTEQTSDENLKRIVKEICEQLKSGKSLSETLQKFPRVFSELYVNSVYIGEISGNLDKVLDRLISHIESEIKLKKDVKKAIRYPMFVIVMLVAAFITFITFVIPRFEPVFAKSNVELPFPTRMILALNHFFSSYGFIALIIITIFVVTIAYFYKTERGQYIIHTYLLKIPVYGMLITKMAFQRFASTLALLNSNGIPLVHAMDTVLKIESNRVFKEDILEMQKSLEKGEKIVFAMAEKKLFSDLMIHMVSVGEVTGSIHEMLENAADYSATEINEIIENITVLIEPVVTIILALMVLVLALSIFLPMWNMLGIL